jgi:dynein heavy chain
MLLQLLPCAAVHMLRQSTCCLALQVPWPALEYVIGQINYGGRVTDDLDRRCLMAIMRRFITPDVLQPRHAFTASGQYSVPADSGSAQQYRQYIQSLPAAEAPEVFGMHANADIVFQLQVGWRRAAGAGAQPGQAT